MRRLFAATWEALALRLHPLVRVDSNTIHQKNGTNAQSKSIYSSESGSTFGRLRIEKVSGSWRFISETNAGSSDGDIQFYLGTGSSCLSFSGSDFFPCSTGVNLGGSVSWNQLKATSIYGLSSNIAWASPDVEIGAAATGRLWVRRLASNGGGTGIQVGDSNSNGFILKKGSSGEAEIRTGDDSAYQPIVALKHCYSGTSVCDFAGSGSPEGSVTASVGSTYRRTDGGAGTSFYVKESGSGNTGWVAK